MADTITFVQGSATLDLDDGTAYETKAIELTTPAPDALMHMPDYGENRVVRTEDKDRQAILRLRVPGASWDAVFNSISEIRRWLREAARAEVDDDTDPVYLQLKRGTTGSTATNATNHRIRFGWIEGDSSVFTPWGEKAEQAIEIFVNLHLTPFGDMATDSVLDNVLASSSHFVEDNDAAGWADGWNERGAGTVTSIDTTAFLMGGKSQKVVANATEGIYSDTVTNVADTEAAGYIWAYVVDGNWVLSLYDVIAPGNLDTATMTADGALADSGFTRVDAAGNTWYRYTVSEAAIPGNNNVRLEIEQGTVGEYTAYFDCAYLELGRTTVPDVWASTASLLNRNDPTEAENYINYIDIGLIPGDAPAQMLLTNTFQHAANDYYQIWCLEQDGKYNAESIPYVINSDDLILLSGTGAYDATKGAGAYHDGDRAQYIEDVGENGCRLAYTFSAGDTAILAGRIFKVIVGCMSDDAAGTIALDIGSGDGTVKSRTAGIAGASNYELKYVGLFRPSPLMDSAASSASLQLYLDIDGIANTKIFEVDVIFLMPVDRGAVVTKQWANNVATHIDGPRNSVYSNFGLTDYIGRPFDLLPGLIMNRLRVLNYDSSDDDYNMADAFPITLTITPRTRHLMGAA